MGKKTLLLLLVLFLSGQLPAQNAIGLREIVNFEKQKYNAGAQNWEIRQDVQGRMYFANNEGLLCFDGTYWRLYPLPKRSIVRSVEFGQDHRVYVGGQDEIGYFSTAKNGRLQYTSLKELLPEPDRKFEDIWDIINYDNAIFFRTSNRIFRYSSVGNTFTVYRPASSWLFIGIDNGRLLALDAREGIQRYANGGWSTYIESKLLPAELHITSIISFDKDTSVITTVRDGLFTLSDGKLTAMRLTGMDINPYQNFSGAVKVDEDNFVVGTYTNGFYLVNKRGQVQENFSKKEGLQNSNVRSLFKDRGGNIWLGLESGIDFIAFNSAIKHINPPELNDGAGYSVVVHNNTLYAGLSNGIYQLLLPDLKDLSYAKSSFKLVPGTEGQVWGLSIINNKVLAGRHEGFFELKNNAVFPIATGVGYWIFNEVQNFQQSSLIAAGNYRGVRLFEYKDNIFTNKGAIPDFIESSRYMAVDNNNVVWVSHPYRGVYKIQLVGYGANVKLYTETSGLPSALNNQVYKVKNRIVIATDKGIYEYSQHDTFEPSAYFREIFGDQPVRYLKEDLNGNIWFIQEKNIGVVDFSTLKPSLIYLPELKGKMVSGFEHIYPVNDNNIFVGGEKGIYHINYEKYRQGNHPISVYIRTVKATDESDSLLFGGYFGNVNEDKIQDDKEKPAVSHQWNSFHIEYSSPLFEQQSNIEYSYYLEGFDKSWSEWGKKTEKDYTNLPGGTYAFHVKARNNLGNESVVSSYSFTVLPPWYQAPWAYALYAVMVACLAMVLYERHKKKLLKERQKHLEEQKRQAYLHQLELEKSEKELMRLRNEKLESEIEYKNSELASTAMHLVQKEEFLGKIKGELQHLNKNGKENADPGELKKILRILSEEEKLNAEWEQFSLHFNKVHSNFLIKLKEKYPALKAHELKLCAYLRMNLSSKEIAQLMSISIRGVEISRYRVRKKLQIPTEVNLFQFLFDLQRNDFDAPSDSTQPEEDNGQLN